MLNSGYNSTDRDPVTNSEKEKYEAYFIQHSVGDYNCFDVGYTKEGEGSTVVTANGQHMHSL